MAKQIVVSGMRATGDMHLGHLEGALKNWIDLQDDYQCYYFVADYHALFSEFKDTTMLNHHAINMVRDWLAVGIDPNKAAIFKQSDVPQHAELYLLLAPFVPMGWLERCPTYKEQVKQLSSKEVTNYGFFGYPVLQTADIVLYNGNYVPVGEDQVVHLEISREIVRRFNQFYPDTLIEPQPKLATVKKLLGTDNRKMSKSYGNAIGLGDDTDTITKRVVSMITDPTRIRLKDPGHPDECTVFSYYGIYADEQLEDVRQWCTSASKGCMDCKKNLSISIDNYVQPIRQRRSKYSDDDICDILRAGAEQASAAAQATIDTIKSKLNF